MTPTEWILAYVVCMGISFLFYSVLARHADNHPMEYWDAGDWWLVMIATVFWPLGLAALLVIFLWTWILEGYMIDVWSFLTKERKLEIKVDI